MSSRTCTPALRPALPRRAVQTLECSSPTRTDGSAAPLSERRSCRPGHQPATARARLVMARDLRPGDVVQQYDWLLHVREVNVRQADVAIAVTEFGFPLHYAADAHVRLAA
jgi:hypothetical protein